MLHSLPNSEVQIELRFLPPLTTVSLKACIRLHYHSMCLLYVLTPCSMPALKEQPDDRHEMVMRQPASVAATRHLIAGLLMPGLLCHVANGQHTFMEELPARKLNSELWSSVLQCTQTCHGTCSCNKSEQPSSADPCPSHTPEARCLQERAARQQEACAVNLVPLHVSPSKQTSMLCVHGQTCACGYGQSSASPTTCTCRC